jgi:hypothetical protein
MTSAQFDEVKSRCPGATREVLPSRAALITFPDFRIPQGWNKSAATVRFIEPNGYPLACPDCFWTDGDLRLANGATPQNTGANAIPETQFAGLLWFSWHVRESWNPNRDSLLTWIACICDRFRKLQ